MSSQQQYQPQPRPQNGHAPRRPFAAPFSWRSQNPATANEHPQLPPRAATDLIYRYVGDPADPADTAIALLPVRISAYNLRWPDLKGYLERKFNVGDLRDLTAGRNNPAQGGGTNGMALRDHYIVKLPRELTLDEYNEIDALRKIPEKEQTRRRDRSGKIPIRPLDSDDD